ncbi:MAG: alpha/beta hydrolase [Dehalococcoidia bacterium]
MPYADIPGVRIRYEDTGGSGTPVVFLHPVTGTADSWSPQLPEFVAEGYRCITYDRRGWGKSQTDPKGEQPGYAADDLHGLADFLGLDRFHLVGSGGGAFLALDYAAAFPERLRSILVTCSMGGLTADKEYTSFGSKFGRPPEHENLPAWYRELSPSYRVANPEGVERWIEIHEASRHEPRVVQPMRNRLTLKDLAAFRVPALLIAGGADLIAPPPRMKLMASSIPNCQFAVIPETGHSAHWENPEVWNRITLNFLNAH